MAPTESLRETSGLRPGFGSSATPQCCHVYTALRGTYIPCNPPIREDEIMRAEIEKSVESIRESLTLLRRSL